MATSLAGLTTGTRYYAAVTAVDRDGNESACSPLASAVARADTSESASLTVGYTGKLRDRVGPGNLGLARTARSTAP